MQTIKTAVVVVLLLGVCYGAYVALNAPEPVLPPELEAWSSENGGLDLDVEEGAALSIDIPQLGDAPRADLDALTPPNLTPLDSGSTASAGQASKSGSLDSGPVPPPLSFGQLDTPPIGGASLDTSKLDGPKFGSPENSTAGAGSSELGLPPELEGSSVPLPSATNPSGTMTSVVPKQNDSLPISLPGFPAAEPPSGLSSLGSPPGTLATPVSASSSAGLAATLPGGTSGSNLGGSTDASALGGSSANKSQSGAPTQPYKTAREEALKLANEGKLREALAKMSPYYNHIDLTRDEQLDLIDLLDALAAEVIYSRRHLLESPFIVAAGDTLESIASRYQISPETLAKINMMGDSKVVLANTQLKVLQGPMRADVNLTRGELTLFLRDLYAGRFPISVGKDPAPVEGTYEIIDRRRDRTYYGANSQVLPASDGRNPYGGYWMSLGKDMCIHGSPETSSPELANAGCISLAPLDAREVYSLLSQGSQVTIHR
ncbi:MAG: L,D-transpeptidase family protein [Aureliella sp.]